MRNLASAARISLLAGCAILLPHVALADSAAEIAELKAQLQLLTQRLSALEQSQTTASAPHVAAPATPAPKPVAAAPLALPPQKIEERTPVPAQIAGGAPRSTVAGEGEPIVGGSLPGSFKLPGTQTSVRIAGYAKLDAIYDANGAYGAQFANFANIPLKGAGANQFDDQFNMHARQTRIGLETSTPTELGAMKTLIEVDFFGAAAGNRKTLSGEGIQLRHAYGEIGRVLAGQTWSNFMDLDAYPESLDFVGVAGIPFIRQGQVRYTDKFNDTLTWSVSAEAPHSDITSPVATNIKLSDTPDFTAKLQYKDSFGHIALRGLARRIGEGDTLTPVDDSTWGYGLGLSGKLLVGKKDSFLFMLSGGEGIGRYIFDVANSNNGSTFAGGTVDAQLAYGGYMAYQHFWADDWRSNFMMGYVGIDNDITRTGLDVNKQITSAHANLIWSPFPSYRVGLEYMHGYREQESGIEGTLDRLQASFMYLF